MADDLFRTTSLSSKTKFEGSSRLSSDKQAVRTSTLVFDDTASKSRFASPAKAYLPVFNLVPRYDDDIFEGVPGTKTATAGTVNDDLIGVFEAVKSTAAPHVGVQFGRTRGVEHTSKPSSGTGSTERRTMDVSSSASRDGLSELNSFQSSKSRWGRHHTKYERWSQQPSSAVSNDSVHKPAKMDCPDDLSVDPFNPGNRQARESTILDSLDPFNMKYYTGGRNVPVMSNPSEDTKRAKENDASIGSSQSTNMPMSSHSKPSRNSYVRKLENGNIPSSEIPRRVGALEDRSVGGQHVHGNGLTTSTFSTPVTPSTSASRKSQYNANIDSRYSSSPIKSNEFLPGKLTPRTQFNLEHISKSIRQTEPRGFEEVWLTIDDFRLVTQPTSAPPPSRSPPPFGLNRKAVAPRRKSKSNQNKDFDNKMLEGEEHFSNTKVVGAFTMGRQAAKTPISGLPSFQEKEIKLSKAQLESTSCDFLVHPSEQRVASVAAASELDMKDAIKRAEALLKLGKELEEKELLAKAADDAKNEEKENVVGDAHSLRKKEPNHADAKERKAEQQGNSRHRVHEGTKNRSAFELANQEAHERASETRERAERAAVQRIAEEVRERAATEAREKVATKIKAVTEAREKAAAEARERAAAEARERVATEARERVAAEAREKAAAEAREKAAAEEREIAQLRERGAAEARGKAAAEAREKERAAAQAREKERAAAEARERERAATEARERERAAAEAREKEATEAREKAARELMEKLAAEAGEKAAAEEREKLVAEAREKAVAEERARMAEEAREKIAAEARVRAAAEKVAAQARARSERAAVQRANAEARERAAEKAKAEARQRAAERAAAERAAAEARTREESAQKRRPATPDPMNASHPSKVFQNEEDRTSASGPSSMKTSPTIIPDDWMPFFVASPTTEFQEMRGELSDRRQVRLERHQRTTERMAKALAEKNQRDFEVQREQAEKQRAAEILDAEIRRWAVGKEGNLRALLSTLHYVLWPGCGWQPVSVSDLVTAAAVKKIYRKATLCVHPDKVQQKGSSVQQKYIAEKVFDLLKDAWNKFSSEGLF